MILNTELEQKGNQFPSKIISYKKDVDTLYFTTDNFVVLQVTVRRDSVIRFRYSTKTILSRDFSYAITKYASSGFNHLEIEEDDKDYVIITSKLIVKIAKEGMKKRIYDAKDKKLICEDEIGFHWEESYEFGGDIVKMSKVAQDSEAYYGLGDKPVHVNLKGRRFENWVTDSYAYGRETDPIYKAIPFYIGLHHTKAYGIFFDNSFRSYFDFCAERRNITGLPSNRADIILMGVAIYEAVMAHFGFGDLYVSMRGLRFGVLIDP